MPRFEYQFDTRIDDSRSKFKRRLRLVVLFLIISAVTAGIIYLIIPENKGKQVTVEDGSAVPAADGQNNVTSISDENKNTGSDTPEHPANQTESAGKDVNELPGDDTSANGEPKVPGVVYEKGTESVSETPQKGKVWAGDPVNDVPVKVENNGVADSLGELKNLLSQRNYDRLAAKSIEVINKENEGSENYRAAAKYLLEARKGQLESATGVQAISVKYNVRRGDTLSHISRHHKTTVAGLMHFNNLKKPLIRIGDNFIVHPGPWSIAVSKSQRLLKLYNGNSNRTLFAVFEIGVGRLNSTPAGDFVISSRIKSPRWITPDGRVFEPGEPGNELGSYFLKLAAVGNPDRPVAGYGIHGTPDESTVGRSLSSGCIRMRNADVELLYNLVPERTPVTITE